MTMACRITWTKGRYADFRGCAGGIELFSINYHTARNDPTYFLRVDLPGRRHITAKSDSADALKARAEQVLDAWLAKVGAAHDNDPG